MGAPKCSPRIEKRSMKCTKTQLLYKNTEYTLVHSVFSATGVNCITVKGTGILQYVYNHGTSFVSYTHGPIENERILLNEYLNRLESGIGSINTIEYKGSTEYSIPASNIQFRTAKHSFIATIKEEPYHYSVKTGGKGFVSCVEIMIDKVSDKMQLPTIAQIYSEPECWYKAFHTNNDIVDLIKGTLQLCQLLFGTSKFMLYDKSAIECGGNKNLAAQPPRKMKRALSLAPLSLIKYCKTWYQYNFNASIDPSEKSKDAFAAGLDVLQSHVDIPFDTFVRTYRLTNDQSVFLKPMYEDCYGKKSWLAFFHAIPSKHHCSMFYNWLPTFIDNHIMKEKFYMNRVKWIIDLGAEGQLVKEEPVRKVKKANDVPTNIVEPMLACHVDEYPTRMVRTDLYLLTDIAEIDADRPWKGGRGTRKRKQTKLDQWQVLSFSNDVLPTRR